MFNPRFRNFLHHQLNYGCRTKQLVLRLLPALQLLPLVFSLSLQFSNQPTAVVHRLTGQLPFSFEPFSWKSVFTDADYPMQFPATLDDARRLSAEGRFHAAASLLLEAFRADPENADVARELGATLRSSGDLQSAVEYLDRAHNGNPADARTVAELVLAYHAMNKHERASQVLIRFTASVLKGLKAPCPSPWSSFSPVALSGRPWMPSLTTAVPAR